MTLTLLLDLDDTLLANDMDAFVPGYLGAFAREVTAYIDPERFVELLLAGTKKMIENRRPDCTLKDVFDETFFPALGMDSAVFQDIADRFYAQVFPTLKDLTKPIPDAIELVDKALERGYRTAVATNPLFPLTAIQQRLDWAKLPVDKHPFELISSYETFHFAKPDATYFAEVMARLGWPDDPVLVVGNDLELDIKPAQQAGLPTFWVTADNYEAARDRDNFSARGRISDVLPWLDKTPDDYMRSNYSSLSAMLAILRSTPAVLDSLCGDLPANIGQSRPDINQWCLTEILCHLRDVDLEVNLRRLDKVLQETDPFLPGVDSDPWADEREYILQDGGLALECYTSARIKLLDMLENLDPEDWQRPARHAIIGPTDMAELVSIIAAHDRLHIQQVHKVLGNYSA